jgi:DNA polymerase-3 subunit beta
MNRVIAASAAAAIGFAATVERKPFVDALARAGKVVEARNTIPVLSHVLLSCDAHGVLTIGATDLDLYLFEMVTVEHSAPGRVTAELKALAAAVKKMKGTRVRLQDIGGRLAVSDVETGATVRLATLPAADLADILERGTKPVDGAAFEMDAAALRADLERVGPAVSTEETRYYLNGVFFHRLNGTEQLRLAATDGHRLNVATVPLPSGAEDIGDSIVPRKAVGVLVGIMGKKAAGTVRLAFSPSMMLAEFGAFRLVSKLVDGTFPDYARVIPSSNAKRLTVDAPDLAQLAQGVASICSAKARAVVISAHPDYLVLSASDPENGSAAVVSQALAYEGEPVAIGFNAAYLSAALKLFDPAEPVTMELSDEAGPALLCQDRDRFLSVVMPMRCDPAAVTPEDVRKLNRTPLEIVDEELPEAVRRGDIATVRALVGKARDCLGSDYVARCRIKVIVALASGDDATAERFRQLRDWAETGARPALAAGPDHRFEPPASEPVEIEPQPQPLPEPEPQLEPQPEPEPVPAIEAAPEPVQEPQEAVEAPEPQPDALAALSERVARLERMLEGEISPAADVVQDLSPDPKLAALEAENAALRKMLRKSANRTQRLRVRLKSAERRLVAERTGDKPKPFNGLARVSASSRPATASIIASMARPMRQPVAA